MAEVKPFVFVLMPFDGSFEDVYRLGIVETCKSAGLTAERVDEQRFTETILERIYRQIHAADFVIADVTGRNPNVFYEVGYAHAIDKPCILITQNISDIPFDLKHHRHLEYSSVSDLKKKLDGEIEWLNDKIQSEKTQPFTVELKKPFAYFARSKHSDTAKLTLTFDIFNKSNKKSPEITAVYLETSESWRMSQEDKLCPSTKSTQDELFIRHFITPPLRRLAPDAWAQIKVTGERTLWSSFNFGEERKDKYPLAGRIVLTVSTDEGNFNHQENLEVEVDEVPF